MNKLTWKELREKIYQHNVDNGVKQQYSDKNPLKCVVVFKDIESWGKKYPLKEKSYAFRSDEKYFLPSMGGNSIFASALAGTDRGIRLDWYLGEWKIDYCYIIEE